MKKQFHRFNKIAETFSRPTKADKNSEELLAADRQIEKFKEVLEKIGRKFIVNPSSSSTTAANIDQDVFEKRCKKVHEYKLAQAMEESLSYLPDGLLHDVLENCAKLEKHIAYEIVNNEINVENNVTKKMALILENNIATIQKQKRVVTKLMQDTESARHKHQTASCRVNENPAKIDQLHDEQMECEKKLEKERDIWASEMFEVIAEEEMVANYVMSYISHQKAYHRSALNEIEIVMKQIDSFMRNNTKKIFKVPLQDHLTMTKRTISYVIELCICCLLEKGLFEEGLLRVGCAGSKLRRLRSAIDANIITIPYPNEYQDAHTIASVLKSYLRDLPEPLLTYELFDQFIAASQRPTDEQRKIAILNVIKQLPKSNYENLRYLSKFLELLSQKSATNKMTPQNIAIVMSPNLLWSSRTSDIDYMSNVSSNASANTIVEALISDWCYFFGDDFTIDDFYITMTRSDLFPDNGGFPVDRDPMTKSLNVPVQHHALNHTTSNQSNQSGSVHSMLDDHPLYQSHSRSSSHDTSQILIENQFAGSSTDSLTKRSHSSNSLSDSSPPPQSSPKLPVRRNKKSAAPNPPTENHAQLHLTSDSVQSMRERFLNSTPNTPQNDSKFSSQRLLQSETKAQFKLPMDPISMKRISGSTENLLSKPNKPPRPNMPNIESLTLTRSSTKGKSERHNRPIALPRSILNVARSTENLCSTTSPTKLHDDGEVVTYRDHIPVGGRSDRPAIPERPMTLMKPNFRTAVFDKFDAPLDNTEEQNSGIKKTQSFRLSSAPATTNGSKSGRSMTTLERTHIYNVDKKQVEIFDVDQSSSGNSSVESPSQADGGNGDFFNGKSMERLDKPSDSDENSKKNHLTSPGKAMMNSCSEIIPQSPRTAIIKRPQIPAPPPPHPSTATNHRSSQYLADSNVENIHSEQTVPKKLDGRASTSAGDSTKL